MSSHGNIYPSGKIKLYPYFLKKNHKRDHVYLSQTFICQNPKLCTSDNEDNLMSTLIT